MLFKSPLKPNHMLVFPVVVANHYVAAVLTYAIDQRFLGGGIVDEINDGLNKFRQVAARRILIEPADPEAQKKERRFRLPMDTRSEFDLCDGVDEMAR